MQFENIVRQTQQVPFHFNLDSASEKEATKTHIFLNHGKYTFGLDAAVDTNQFTLSRVDAVLHLGSLPGKAFGNIDDLISFFQELLASAGPDALLF